MASAVCLTAFVSPVKAVEDVGEILRGNKGAFVVNGKDDAFLFPGKYDLDSAALGLVFDSIFYQAGGNALQVILIGRKGKSLGLS